MRLLKACVRQSLVSCGLLLCIAPAFRAGARPERQAGSPELVRAYGRLPLAFEKNVGQSDGQVRFLSRGAGYALFITDTETVAVLRKANSAQDRPDTRSPLRKRANQNESDPPAVIRMQLAGANEHPRIDGEELLPGKSNYFIGNDPSKWRTNVPQFARVRMTDVYRGIDVVYYGNQQQLEYDLVIRPGADPRQIRLLFRGAERVEVDRSGDLAVHVNGEVLRHLRPAVYQQNANGSRHPVAARYRRRGANEFAVDLAAYDAARPLIIDPVLVYSTYLGGSGGDFANAIAVDPSGNAYVTGYTASTNFPTMNPLQAANGGGSSNVDAFVAKLNAAGSALVYSTYLGGSGADIGQGIAVDASGNAYVAGYTHSTNFPTMNPLQAANGGDYNVFVAKLNAGGSALVYSTYLGGSSIDWGQAIAVDTSGNAYVAGYTQSTNFPTTNPFQAANGGGVADAFVAKLNASGSALVYSTYLGGSGGDIAYAIALDASGDAHVAGRTDSTDFPTMNPLQAANAGTQDAFVAKLNAAGSGLVYSTYLGGSNLDIAAAIAVDTSGNAYVAGYTESTNFPTMNPLQAANAGTVGDAFVAKLNAAGSALIYSTYLGGSSSEIGYAIAVDASRNAYVAGYTTSTNFPTMNPLQAANAGTADAFVAKLNAAGSALVFSTYLGGSGGEIGYAIAVDASGNAYVAGYTESTNFPTLNPLQAANADTRNAFVAKISTGAAADLAVTKSGPTTIPAGNNITYTITVTNNGPSNAQSVTLTDATPANTTFVSENQNNGPAFNCTTPSVGGTGNVVCTIVTLAAGASGTFIIVDRVIGGTPGGTTITNTASVTSTTSDTAPGNNTANTMAIVIPSAAIPLFSWYALMFLASVIAAIAFARLQG